MGTHSREAEREKLPDERAGAGRGEAEGAWGEADRRPQPPPPPHPHTRTGGRRRRVEQGRKSAKGRGKHPFDRDRRGHPEESRTSRRGGPRRRGKGNPVPQRLAGQIEGKATQENIETRARSGGARGNRRGRPNPPIVGTERGTRKRGRSEKTRSRKGTHLVMIKGLLRARQTKAGRDRGRKRKR